MGYSQEMSIAYQTVIETPEFVLQAKKCLSDVSKDEFISHIARNPTDGDLIRGTGGARKIRWASEHKGKSGGIRVIYYYHNKKIPIFLFTAYAKSKTENITTLECQKLKEIIKNLVKAYGG